METISINIKNPKAKKLITDLVDLDLIESRHRGFPRLPIEGASSF